MPSYYRKGAEFAVNSFTAANQTAPAVASFAGGGFVIVWGSLDTAQDGSESAIKAQLFDAAGNKVGLEFRVNSAAPGSQFTPSVATLADGKFVVSWVTTDPAQDGSGNAIKAQLFDSSGAPIGAEFLVNTLTASSQFVPNVAALANGGFVISWDDWGSFDTKAQIYDSGGARVGGEFRLNTNTSAAQEFGDITGLAGGGFVATWRTTDSSADGSDQAVKAQIFDAAGARIGTEFLVNSATLGFQYSPNITALASGGFVVTWYTTDPAQDGSSGAIKAQIFSATGAKVGAEFLVNSQGADNQSDPVVTALPGGGFMVAWTTANAAQDGSSLAVKAQAFDSSGAKAGGEILVNTLATGAQFLQDIATLADGSVVVTWTSESGDGSGYAVRAQIFEPNRAPTIVSDGGGSSAAFSIDEGETAITTVVATDADGPGPVRYAITGGADAALFAVDPVTGALSLADAPDYEAPADGAGDNFYSVIVSASDGELSTSQLIQVLVGNVNEGLSITSASSVSATENDRAAATVTATDIDGDAVTYAIAGGADAASFTIDAETGELVFVATPDFEAPGDAGGDNVYDILVSASDGSFTETQALTVTVGNADEGVEIVSYGGTSTVSLTVPENDAAAGQVAAVDEDGDTVSYAIAGGADAGRFTINAATGALSFVAAPDFEAPGDADGDNVYQVTVAASAGAFSATQTFAVAVGNVNEAPSITSNGGGAGASVSVAENSRDVAIVAAVDPEGAPIAYSIAGGADAQRFAINAQTGALTFIAAPDYETPGDAGGDNVYDVIVRASDGVHADLQTISVAVGNVRDGRIVTGTAQADTISGTSANPALRTTESEDTVFGRGGHDTILGQGGDDWLYGEDGKDALTGGAGADRLAGGAGADQFVYTALSDSTGAARDVIEDFSHAQGDRIALSALDANAALGGNQAFAFIGSAAFSHVAGQLRYEWSGGNTIVSGDVNGDGIADLQIQLSGTIGLVSPDFVL
jgi:Ca2+-binding RTX toxin-like protein